MEFKTMNRQGLAAKLGISGSTLRRKMKQQIPEFEKNMAYKIFLPEDVKYIYENINHSKNPKTGSK